MSTLDAVQRMIDTAMTRAMQLVRRGVIRLATDKGFLQVEGYEGEQFEGVEHWQQYGLASRSPAGTEVLLAKVDGHAEQAIAFATASRQHRPTDLATGDAALYGKKGGSDQAQVRCKADGDVDCIPGSSKTANVGGDAAACTDYLLRGSTFNTAKGSYLTSMVAAGATWTGSPKTLANVVAYIDAHVAAITALNTSHAAGWLATHGKVR